MHAFKKVRKVFIEGLSVIIHHLSCKYAFVFVTTETIATHHLIHNQNHNDLILAIIIVDTILRNSKGTENRMKKQLTFNTHTHTRVLQYDVTKITKNPKSKRKNNEKKKIRVMVNQWM